MTQVNISTSDEHDKERVNTLLQYALQRELGLLKLALEKTKNQLSKLEQKYSFSSEHFHQQYHAGKLGDSDDFIDWAGEYQIYQSLLQQITSLKEVVICK